MDIEDFGVFSLLFIVPYTIALQILLIVFVRRYISARRELMQRIRDEQLLSRTPGNTSQIKRPSNPVPALQPRPAVTAPVPAAVSAPAALSAPVYAASDAPQPKKRNRISSTSITFGVGVLLLTIVGAAFLSVSWSFMGNAARAVTLIAAVVVVYLLSFLSGKVLKLKQTGFAFYTLGSFLGPIVIVGVGMFKLLGKWFSFSGGNGWIVAAVASLIMALSAVIGKFIYRSKFYTGITYFSFTWLVVFVSGQIGEESLYAYPYEAIFIAIAVLAVILRVIMIFKADEAKLDFRIYSELITFASVLLMLISVPVALEDGSKNTFVLIGSVLANAVLILHAKFTPKRGWVRYMAPFTVLNVFLALVCFDYRYPRSVWTVLVFFAVLYVVFFFTKIRTLLSDILFPSVLVIFMLASDSNWDSVFITVVIAAGIGTIMSVLSSVFPKTKPSGVINAGLAGVWYYIMTVELMLKLIGDKDQLLYFVLTMPIPVITAAVLTVIRRFGKDDDRIRTASEVLMWASVFFGTIGLIGAPNYDRLRSFHVIMTRTEASKVWANGILLFVASLLIAYNYLFNAKKKGRLSIPSLIVFSLALNAPAYVAFVPAIVLEKTKHLHYGYRIAFCVMFAVMAGALVLLKFAPVFKKEKLLPYTKPMKHIISAMLCVWTLISLSSFNCKWMLVSMPLVLVALYFCGNEFFSAIPMFILMASACDFMASVVRIKDKNLNNIVIFVVILALFALGRLFYRKRIVSLAGFDYLSFMPLMLLFGFKNTDYGWPLVFLTMALMIFNWIGRTRTPAKIVAAIATIPVAAALIKQPFIDLPDVYMTEFVLAVILADAAVIRFLIKPAEEKVMKYSWFAVVTVCLTVEGISAAISGETFDLIVTGVAAGGIFLFSFIKKSRLWFILGVVSIIGIAVYLSATFWSSMAWLLYLLIAGVIMIVLAAGNEWRKRHSSEGRKLFKEWTW